MIYRNIAIVIVTYNRPSSLNRILRSIYSADYLGLDSIDLIISCDFSGSKDCENIANEFEWNHGHKIVKAHEQNLGLRAHILYCGDLVKNYDGIIMLEDDLWVAPNFYKYVVQADLFFKNNDKIGQISLYNNEIDEFSYSRFIPLNQNADNYFMQVPSSWGQFWTKEQWFGFKKHYDNGDIEIDSNSMLPDWVIENWSASSWKKYFYNYLVKNDLFVVYPYKSLSTNFGDSGTHHKAKHLFYQSTIDYSLNDFNFIDFENSRVIYDYHFELHKNIIIGFFKEDNILDIEFDINGMKNINKISSKYLLSSKFCSNPIQKFGEDLLPQELNIKFKNEGEFYALGLTKDFDSKIPKKKIHKRNISFQPTITISTVEKQVRSIYEDSSSFKIGKKITSFINSISGVFKK